MPRWLEAVHPCGRSSSRTEVSSLGSPRVNPRPWEWGRASSSQSRMTVCSRGDASTCKTAMPESRAEDVDRLRRGADRRRQRIQGEFRGTGGQRCQHQLAPAGQQPRGPSGPVPRPDQSRARDRPAAGRPPSRGLDQLVELLRRQDPQLGTRLEPIRYVLARDMNRDHFGIRGGRAPGSPGPRAAGRLGVGTGTGALGPSGGACSRERREGVS